MKAVHYSSGAYKWKGWVIATFLKYANVLVLCECEVNDTYEGEHFYHCHHHSDFSGEQVKSNQ